MTDKGDARRLLDQIERVWDEVSIPPGALELGEPASSLADGYFSFEDLDGNLNGLVRISEDGTVFERASEGAWVLDRDLLRHFVNPDVGHSLERLNRAAAKARRALRRPRLSMDRRDSLLA